MSETFAGGRLLVDTPAPHLTRLTLNSPEKRNALDHELLDALTQAIKNAQGRCLLLTANGPVFSAGYDIAGLPQNDFARRAEELVAHPFQAALEALESYEYPTVAAINGHAIGGGLELALTCDLRIAASDAQFAMPPVKLGLIYSHTGLRKFIEVIGAARTRELFFTASRISSATALQWGMLSAVFDDGDLAAEAIKFSSQIANRAPLALKGNKRVIHELVNAGGVLSENLERDLIELRQACFESRDFQEGVRAFSEKRPPVWEGQ